MNRLYWVGCVSAALVALAGCQASSETASVAMDPSQMQPPPRAVELDLLEPLMGRWQGTYECSMDGADKPMKMTGSSVMSWEVDKRVGLERYEGTMGDGQKITGLSMWTWNPQKKHFDTFWTDSFGAVAHGTAKWDASNRTWRMTGASEGPMGSTVMEGSGKVIDDKTMEWTMTEREAKSKKVLFDMKGMNKKMP